MQDDLDGDRFSPFADRLASEASEGPGPLVSAIAGKGSGTFPIPITIVPQTLSDEEMDAIA